MNMQHQKIFVGVTHNGERILLFSKEEPTQFSHGNHIAYCIGDFETLEGARFMRDYGKGNPHCRCVEDAERLAHQKEMRNA